MKFSQLAISSNDQKYFSFGKETNLFECLVEALVSCVRTDLVTKKLSLNFHCKNINYYFFNKQIRAMHWKS
jgi:hypothetical protein